jgi:hypothetical protein
MVNRTANSAPIQPRSAAARLSSLDCRRAPVSARRSGRSIPDVGDDGIVRFALGKDGRRYEVGRRPDQPQARSERHDPVDRVPAEKQHAEHDRQVPGRGPRGLEERLAPRRLAHGHSQLP